MEEGVFLLVRKIICETLSVEEEGVRPGTRLVEDLGTDSLDVVEMVMAIEEKFGIEVSDENAEKIRTVQDMLDAVVRAVRGS